LVEQAPPPFDGLRYRIDGDGGAVVETLSVRPRDVVETAR